MVNTKNPQRIVGKALLKKLTQLEGMNRSEKAKACGYFRITNDGNERAKIGEFIEAILDAKGVVLDAEKTSEVRGREASFRVSVHKNGSIVIGSTYTQQMGLEIGDAFEIKLGYKHIHLKQML